MSRQVECEHQPRFWTAFAYFASYTILSALVLLSVFLGVVQIAMDEARMRVEKEEKVR